MCQCYGKIYCFHLRCRRRKQRVPLNHSCLFINPRCVTAKKVIQLFIFTLKTKSRFFQNVGICLPRCMTSCPRLEWSTVSDISIDNAATSVGTWTVQDSIQGQEAWKRLKYVTMRNMTEGESRIKQEDWKHKKNRSMWTKMKTRMKSQCASWGSYEGMDAKLHVFHTSAGATWR